MIDLLLALVVLLLGVLVGLIGWASREGLSALRSVSDRFDTLARLHLRRHPEDLPSFRIGGTL